MSRVEEAQELISTFVTCADIIAVTSNKNTALILPFLADIALSLAVIADAMKKGEE